MISLRKGVPAVVAVMALLAAGACSSAGEGSGGADSVDASDEVKAKSSELVKEYTDRPTSIGITEPVEGPIPKGKTIAFMTCSLSSCTQIASMAEEAAEVLGWKVDRINIGVTPETVKAGYAEAVRRKPDAVMGTGFGPELFTKELDQLNEMDIPVMLTSIANEDPRLTAVYMKGDSIALAGAAQAVWTLSQYGSESNTIVADVPDFTTIHSWFEGFKSKYKELCSDCELEEIAFASADIGTPKLATQIAALVQGNPQTNAIQMATSEMASGLPASLEPLDYKGHIGILNADDQTREYMKNGKITMMSNQVDWPTATWKMMDTAARVFTDQSIDPDLDAPENLWITTGETAPEGSGLKTPIVVDYKEQFMELWGVK